MNKWCKQLVKMVVKRKLPGCLNWIFFINTLYLMSFKSGIVSSSDIQYCWSGVEDDNINWKNLSCATNQASLPNTVAKKSQPFEADSNQTEGDTSASSTGKKYFCMVFKYYETSTNQVNQSTGEVIKELKADYTCDTENWCEGRNMLEGYQFYSQSRKENGYLYCCDYGNNCNTHQLIYKGIHQHTCYIGDSRTQSLRIDHCPQKKSQCVKTVTKKIIPGLAGIETLSEVYSCDINNQVCSNLTEAQSHSCRQTMKKVNNETIETQICCCTNDNCYKPPWAEGDVSWGTRNKPSLKDSWQRTMLIIIGVALGILVVGVTLFFMRRAALNRKLTESPGRQYNKTAYKSMTAENGIDMDDTVQILST